jgi:hypothetical protein
MVKSGAVAKHSDAQPCTSLRLWRSKNEHGHAVALEINFKPDPECMSRMPIAPRA